MAATVRWKVFTGTTAATENPDAAPGTNAVINLLSSDTYTTSYQNYPVIIPSSGTNYSYERWVRVHFSGTFTSISNIKVYRSAGVKSDGAIGINAAATGTAATPVQSVSTIAISEMPTTLASAINITPAAGPITTAGYTKYLVIQAVVPNSVTNDDDFNTHTVTLSYDET